MRINTTILCLTITLFFGFSLQGISQTKSSEGWTQFRGQYGSGISSEKLIDKDWTTNKPELLWRKDIGSGFSELLVSEGLIYTMFSEKIDSVSGYEYLVAYDEKTGDEKWKTKVDSIYIEIDGWGDGPRSTPTIDEKNIYCLSGHGKLSARLKKDGSLIWEKDFVRDFGSTMPRWGYSSSPKLLDNMLIIEVGGKDGRAFMAFDKQSGKTIWEKGTGIATYSTPLIANVDGQDQILFINGRTLYSYNSKGDTLWTFPMSIPGNIVMPVVFEENKIFVSYIGAGFFITQIKDNKGIEILKKGSMKNDFTTSVYHDGYFYGFHVAALRCVSAETGEVKWSKRGFGKGSLILVDGKLVILSDKGKLAIAKASTDAYQELALVNAISGSITWTAPSYTNGKVFVRNQTEMACFKLN
jgi:outer membrane protein assembly factor BamB